MRRGRLRSVGKGEIVWAHYDLLILAFVFLFQSEIAELKSCLQAMRMHRPHRHRAEENVRSIVITFEVSFPRSGLILSSPFGDRSRDDIISNQLLEDLPQVKAHLLFWTLHPTIGLTFHRFPAVGSAEEYQDPGSPSGWSTEQQHPSLFDLANS